MPSAFGVVRRVILTQRFGEGFSARLGRALCGRHLFVFFAARRISWTAATRNLNVVIEAGRTM